jgi:hypothetical protein
VGAPPLASFVKVVPISKEETRVADAQSAVASPIVSDLLRSILDTPEATWSLEAVNVQEASPSRQPRESVEEHIIPPPHWVGGDLVRVRPNLSTWGGLILMWTAS